MVGETSVKPAVVVPLRGDEARSEKEIRVALTLRETRLVRGRAS